MKPFLAEKIRFEQVKGVGTIEVNLPPNQQVYTFIGENGVGKTKFLESLFTSFLLINNNSKDYQCWIDEEFMPFKVVKSSNLKMNVEYFRNRQKKYNSEHYQFSYPEEVIETWAKFIDNPVVYISAQNRGAVVSNEKDIEKIGSVKDRKRKYLENLFYPLIYDDKAFRNLNTNVHIEEWIIQRAKSANPYQNQEDNREVEIKELLFLINKIDDRIDPEFLEISGDNRVFIKIEGQKRELSELSSGFSSILKMIQSIIAGYSYFTNETQIANVRGIVLIDEIESHLHNQWQAKIIPLLKKLFPNTVFFITTHSSLVISQLNHGEAYRLKRNAENGVVYADLIDYPSKVSFIDLLNDAFDVNLNNLKISRAQEEGQQEAKQALLKLVQQELANLGNSK